MKSILSSLLHWWAARRTRRELLGLSDRTLQDIGMSRSDIDSLFR